jgi:hypothetical protein
MIGSTGLLRGRFAGFGKANGRRPASGVRISMAVAIFLGDSGSMQARRGAKTIGQFLGGRRGCNFRLAGGYQTV